MSVFIGNKNKRVELAERKDATNPNLFSNTDEMSNFWQSFIGENGSVEPSAYCASDTNHELIATKSVFHAYGSTADVSAIETKQQIYFESGLYTISFLARNNGTDKPSFTIQLFSDYTDQRNGTPLGATSTNLTNVWQQYSITFEIAEAGTYGNWRLLNDSKLGLPGGSLFFANLKLEHGSVATPWCPALEDIAWKSDITNLQNTVNNKVNVDGDLFLAPGSINSWADIQADGNKSVLRSVRTEGQATDFDTGNYDAGILFGGNDTKALISVGYTGNQARVTGGNNSAVWHEDIAWKSDITNLQSMITGLSTKVDSDVATLQGQITEIQQSSHKIVPITQADYDALSTKDPNTIYAIGG